MGPKPSTLSWMQPGIVRSRGDPGVQLASRIALFYPVVETTTKLE